MFNLELAALTSYKFWETVTLGLLKYQNNHSKELFEQGKWIF